MNKENTKYHVISPDGMPITIEPFENKEAAEKFIPQWCERFKEQGYYKSVTERIPLDELAGRLLIVPEDNSLREMMQMIDQEGPGGAGRVLNDLMNEAELYATAQMRGRGQVTPALFIHGVNGIKVLAPENFGNVESKDAFVQVARLMCLAEGADATVLTTEAWARTPKNGEKLDITIPPSEASDREEVVVLMGQRRGLHVQKSLPILRSARDKFIGFGDVSLVHADKAEGRFSNFLSDEIPPKKVRETAQSIVEEIQAAIREEKRPHRGRGRAMF